MTNDSSNVEKHHSRPSTSLPSVPTPSRAVRLWTQVQFVVCLVTVGGILSYLLWTADTGSPGSVGDRSTDHSRDVRLAGPRCICVRDDCPLCRKLQVTIVRPTPITTPLLTVTGTVVASLRPGNGKGNDYWQFDSLELLTTFTDWQKATADIAFLETQLTQIKQLAETRTSAQEKLVERMKKLVEAGTDTERDLAAAQAELIQSQVEGRKEVYEAETAVRLARRTEAALARQLQQVGLEPELLGSIAVDVDMVVADVPEGLAARAKLAQGCDARFFGLPDQTFQGKVRAIAPVLSKERRSLRVLFAISDPHDQLRPGMFADIGLGTDARSALLIPPEGVVHVGRADYVLVRDGRSDWRVTEVQVGELHDEGVEIVGGLRAGDQIAGRGAILLKPLIIQALQSPKRSESVHALQVSSTPKNDPT
ncbi:MAG TPA: efflux RND transporter periplasmic adaptor subunit [Thermoguttaceae bacterium]|nr:efflux RND transporter periplasmic adaptor subunit [Thermoguttaceae bacterium]